MQRRACMQNIDPAVAGNIDRIVESLNDEYFAQKNPSQLNI
jgi:hypothetical protein